MPVSIAERWQQDYYACQEALSVGHAPLARRKVRELERMLGVMSQNPPRYETTRAEVRRKGDMLRGSFFCKKFLNKLFQQIVILYTRKVCFIEYYSVLIIKWSS